MILSCPECSKRYVVAPEVFGAEARQVRCANCAHVWLAEPPDEDHEIAPKHHVEKPAEAQAPEEPQAEGEQEPEAPSPAPDEGPDKDDREDEAADHAPAGQAGPEDSEDAHAAPEDAGDEPEAEEEGDIDPDIAAGLGLGTEDARVADREDDLHANLPALRSDRSRLVRLGWWALVMFWLAIGAAALVLQDTLVQRWPALQPLYAMAGLDGEGTEEASAPEESTPAPVNRENLTITQTAEPRQQADGSIDLFLSIELGNSGEVALPLPPFDAVISDSSGTIIATQVIPPPAGNLPGGQSLEFTYTIEDIPPASATLNVIANWPE